MVKRFATGFAIAALATLSSSGSASSTGSPSPPALARCGEGTGTAWLQPTTVQRGDSFLMTGIDVPENTSLLFNFFHFATGKQIHYITRGWANGNCVVNQEFIDTGDFKKGQWSVSVQAVTGNGIIPTIGVQLAPGSNSLNVTDRTSPAPSVAQYPCAQPAHAWFGPSVVNFNQDMFIAAVARPNSHATFFIVQAGGRTLVHSPLWVGPAGSNCVADHRTFRASVIGGRGTFDVYAGYFDEFNRYRHDFLGTLTIN
jgi:hypothetical protein